MPTMANINIRVEQELKKNAEELFRDLGLTMSGAITLFLRTAVNNDGIPFEVKRAKPNDVTKAALDEYAEMQRNHVLYKRYHSFDDLFDEVMNDV